jgi:diguanylate cyclase (GGDEF)-like protein
MVAPLYSETKLIGFIGVDNPNENTYTLSLLRSVASLIVNDIQKRITLEQRVINALARIYISMYLVNIPADTQKEFNSNSDVRKYVKQTEHASEQMRTAMEHMTDAQYWGGTLAFSELTTLNERMKHCDYISHEFYSSTDKWCRANFIVVDRLENGDLNNVIYGVQLIDDEKKKELEYQAALEHALANQNEIYGELLQMQSGGVIAVEIKTNRILVINRALLDMLGIDETKKNQLTHEDFLSHFVDKKAMEKYLAVRDTLVEPYVREYEVMRGDEHVFVLCHTKLITLANGDRVSLTSVMNITENKKFEQRLLVQSRMDALTKICNRGYGEAQIEKLLKAKKNGMFLLFDVDKFKHINDTYGHLAGDKVIKMVASIDDKFARAHGGFACRYGGEEFLLVLPGYDETQALPILEEMHKEIQTTIVQYDDKEIPVNVCIGLSAYPTICRDTNILVNRADKSMYYGKKHGRGRLVVDNPAVDDMQS